MSIIYLINYLSICLSISSSLPLSNHRPIIYLCLISLGTEKDAIPNDVLVIGWEVRSIYSKNLVRLPYKYNNDDQNQGISKRFSFLDIWSPR